MRATLAYLTARVNDASNELMPAIVQAADQSSPIHVAGQDDRAEARHDQHDPV